MQRYYRTYKEGDQYYAVIILKNGFEYHYGPYLNRSKAYRESIKYEKELARC